MLGLIKNIEKYPYKYFEEQQILMINADCLEVMQNMEEKSIDSIITDIPYGTTACSWDNVIPFEPMWNNINHCIKDNGAIALFGSEPFSSKLRMSNLKMYRYDWKWDKVIGSNFINAKKMPLKIYEDIIIFYNLLPTYNPQKTIRDKTKARKSSKKSINPITKILSSGNATDKNYFKYPVNKIEINRLAKELNSKYVLHPTQKPVALIEYLIKTYTQENELVLDFTSGSGTTAISSYNLKRKCICIEKDTEYWEKSVKRCEEHFKQMCFDF